MKLQTSSILAITAAILSFGFEAHAQTPSATTRADSLFLEAQRAFDAGKIHEACPLFAESYRLEAAAGALLNLAVCHEKEGKIATAWKEFQAAERMSQAANQRERAIFARKKVADLSATVPYVKFVFGAPQPRLSLVLDGEPLSEEAAMILAPMDPGPHELVASAEERRSRTVRFEVPAHAKATSVRVEELESLPAKLPARPVVTRIDEPRPKERFKLFSRTNVTIALAATAVTGVVIGSYYGVRTLGEDADSGAHCGQTYCDPIGLGLRADARSHALASTIAFGIGAASLGGLTYVLLSDFDTAKKPSVALRVTPTFGAGAGGFSAEGVF